MRTPQTYRITGRVSDGVVTYYLLCDSSTAAYYIAREFWPDLEICSVNLLEEWQDAPKELEYA